MWQSAEPPQALILYLLSPGSLLATFLLMFPSPVYSFPLHLCLQLNPLSSPPSSQCIRPTSNGCWCCVDITLLIRTDSANAAETENRTNPMIRCTSFGSLTPLLLLSPVVDVFGLTWPCPDSH